MLERIGDKLCGFTVTRVRPSEELGGRLVEMVYDRTGTELCWVDNGENNKLFSITFKTVPEDSTGVFHILEHSVLCGSEKFPVREPFVELLKSSMNTFLNAMTFSDKTMYPVSSRNRKDFLNLTEVYLDAVFAPSILKDPNIFYQEGWHMEEEKGELQYKGVVFNEMKGAMSGVDRILEEELMDRLFPGSCYGFNSGGEPTVIPDLTYEKFKETYARFYHPSNARIFLDGDVPPEETLRLIASYLDRFDKSERLPEIALQKKAAGSFRCAYELSRDEKIEDRCHLAFGKIACSWQERAKDLAVQVLLDAVAGSNDSPLKRAVLSSGMAQEMDVTLEDGIAQPFLAVQFKNIKDGCADKLLSLTRKTASEMAENGLDKEALKAAANRLEYRMRDLEEPAGLERCILSMNAWLYGGDPLQYLVCREDFAEVRAAIEDGTMERLLRELFVEADGAVTVLAEPSYEYGEELRKKEAARLAAVKAGWSEKDLAANREKCEKLLAWQQTPDSPEKLSTIPVLDLSEVSPEPEIVETRVSESAGVRVLFHPVKTGGLVHLNLYFALTDLSLEELSLVNYAGEFFGEIGTARRDSLS
ncbi:MAG: insulinase family protein, partial [Clostridia bacterium]|nr:insulinase family protein [Clostridia bacterium]